MTAINIRTTAIAATVWADGLQYFPDGTIAGFQHKARRIGDWKAIVITTGLAAGGEYLQRVLPESAASFDEFRAQKETILPILMDAFQEHISASAFPRFAAFIVGWSDDLGLAEIIVYDDHQGTGHGTIGTTGEIISPRLSEEEKAGVALSLKSVSCKPRDIAIAVMEAQRRRVANPEFSSAGHVVGGHISETVIDASGVRDRIVHRWNDRVGEKVTPSATYPTNVEPLVGRTRADRRREKALRKGRAA